MTFYSDDLTSTTSLKRKIMIQLKCYLLTGKKMARSVCTACGFDILISLWRVLLTDPARGTEALIGLLLDESRPKPILWPFRVVGSRWWWIKQTSHCALIFSLVIFQITGCGLESVTSGCQLFASYSGLIDLSGALPSEYRSFLSGTIPTVCYPQFWSTPFYAVIGPPLRGHVNSAKRFTLLCSRLEMSKTCVK